MRWCYVRCGGTSNSERGTVENRCDDGGRAVLSQRRDGDRGGTGRQRSDHHRAGADTGAATNDTGAKPVHADRAKVRHPAHRLGPSQPAACARRGASGAIPAGGRSPAARPAGGDGPGRIGRLQSASRPDPLSSHQYRHHAPAGADPQHAADRQRHPAGDHPGAERHHGRAGPAIHSRHHLQRRGRRPAGRRPDHPRLRRARRPVPRRHPRSRLVYPRRVLDRPHRSLQGPVGIRVRPRRHRRRHQLCDQAADRCELSRVRPRR